MSRTLAIVAVKDLKLAKSKMSGIFPEEERKKLVLCMLEDVLRAVESAPLPCMVISPDEAVLRLARSREAMGVRDEGKGVSQAFELGRREAVRLGFESVLLLVGDIPLLTAWDLQEMMRRRAGDRAVVISPTQGRGTAAMLLQPPCVIPLHYGGRSFARHVEEALRAGVKPAIYESANLWDMDEPADLLRVLGSGRRTEKFLLEMGWARQVAHQES